MENNWDTQDAYHKVIEFIGKPKVTDGTATVQGWHYLQRIKQKHLELYLEAKGLGVNKYLDKLKEGLEATKMEPVGDGKYDERPDHKARRGYHRALGEMHGVEGKNIEVDASTNNIQINIISYDENKKKNDTPEIIEYK